MRMSVSVSWNAGLMAEGPTVAESVCVCVWFDRTAPDCRVFCRARRQDEPLHIRP